MARRKFACPPPFACLGQPYNRSAGACLVHLIYPYIAQNYRHGSDDYNETDGEDKKNRGVEDVAKLKVQPGDFYGFRSISTNQPSGSPSWKPAWSPNTSPSLPTGLCPRRQLLICISRHNFEFRYANELPYHHRLRSAHGRVPGYGIGGSGAAA